MFGTSSETISRDFTVVEISLNELNERAGEPQIGLTECPEQDRESLRDLKEHLSRGSVPNCFYYRNSLEEFLDPDERSKLALFRAIQTGLEESAAVFQPKRYKSDYFREKQLAETTLWFRAFQAKHVTASQASRAFEAHIREGRRFPAPINVLDRITDVGTVAQPEKPAKRKYY